MAPNMMLGMGAMQYGGYGFPPGFMGYPPGFE